MHPGGVFHCRAGQGRRCQRQDTPWTHQASGHPAGARPSTTAPGHCAGGACGPWVTHTHPARAPVGRDLGTGTQQGADGVLWPCVRSARHRHKPWKQQTSLNLLGWHLSIIALRKFQVHALTTWPDRVLRAPPQPSPLRQEGVPGPLCPASPQPSPLVTAAPSVVWVRECVRSLLHAGLVLSCRTECTRHSVLRTPRAATSGGVASFLLAWGTSWLLSRPSEDTDGGRVLATVDNVAVNTGPVYLRVPKCYVFRGGRNPEEGQLGRGAARSH